MNTAEQSLSSVYEKMAAHFCTKKRNVALNGWKNYRTLTGNNVSFTTGVEVIQTFRQCKYHMPSQSKRSAQNSEENGQYQNA